MNELFKIRKKMLCKRIIFPPQESINGITNINVLHIIIIMHIIIRLFITIVFIF